MNEQPNAARRRRARGAKLNPRQARQLMLGGGALLFVLISLFGWLLSDAAGGPGPKDDPAILAAASAALPGGPVILPPSSGEEEPQPEQSSPEEAPSSEPASSGAISSPEPAASEAPSSSEAVSSQPEASSSEPAASEAPSSSEDVSSRPEDSSNGTPGEASPSSEEPSPDSSAEPSPAPEPPASPEEPVGEAPATIDLNELDQPEEDEPGEGPDDGEEEEPDRGGARSNPKSHPGAEDEELLVSVGGVKKRMNAFDLICRAVQNETNGLLAPEALKAHAVATYTMIRYNNERGIAPSVVLKTPVSSSTEKAVEAVIGQAVYYGGQYANTVYHSTSSGKTTSSQAVWGGALPYLVPVDSPYDKKAPGYKSIAAVTRKNFAKRVEQVYGIELDGDPGDWITAERDAPGGYVGTVEIGGYTRSQGGSYGTGAITGRSVREQLLSFGIRSHCFEVEYDEDGDRFLFTTYGYGHGVGMSQYGAHYMALDGYDYLEILEHYYTGVTVE